MYLRYTSLVLLVHIVYILRSTIAVTVYHRCVYLFYLYILFIFQSTIAAVYHRLPPDKEYTIGGCKNVNHPYAAVKANIAIILTIPKNFPSTIP